MDKLPFLQSLLAISSIIKDKFKNISFRQKIIFSSASILAVFLSGIFIFGSGLTPGPLIVTHPDVSSDNDLFARSLNGFMGESLEMVFLQKNSIVGISSPLTITSQSLGAIWGTEDNVRKEIIEYTVQTGDTISTITDKFAVSLDTVLWANDLDKKSTIKPGQQLIILPVSGVLYYIQKDDTLGQIAKDYKASVEEIITFNELPEEGRIYIGDILIIPGGKMPAPVLSKPLAVSPQIPTGESYFIVPVSSPYIITQGLHWYNAIDFAHKGNSCGKSVFAAAGGVIQKTGFNRTAGNYVRILHPNGVVTFYGHLSSILVSAGQQVSQGAIIGYIGNTGYTVGATGCHLHFEVRGARNSFAP
ncbi:MAG: M23 family metallopeptidase [Candidatus Nealsonbacteria bacterium]|nr:M23 family metallopeptidase [Candidatus Nealsonbacteria bacterium]